MLAAFMTPVPGTTGLRLAALESERPRMREDSNLRPYHGRQLIAMAGLSWQGIVPTAPTCTTCPEKKHVITSGEAAECERLRRAGVLKWMKVKRTGRFPESIASVPAQGAFSIDNVCLRKKMEKAEETCMYIYVYKFIDIIYIYIFIYSFIYLFVHLSIYLFDYLSIYSFTYTYYICM